MPSAKPGNHLKQTLHVRFSHFFILQLWMVTILLFWQGAKKIIFTACHWGKLKLAFTSPDVISISPKNFLTSRIDFTVLLSFKFLKKHHLPSGKLKTEFTSPIAKSTSPKLLNTTSFSRCSGEGGRRTEKVTHCLT